MLTMTTASFTMTKQTQALIGAIVGPTSLVFDVLLNTPQGKPPNIQKIVGHLAAIGVDLLRLLDEDFVKDLSEEWRTKLFDAVGTAVTGLVPLFVDAAKLVAHFAPSQKP